MTVKLKNGETIHGVARNRNNYSLQIIERDGGLHLLSMRDVAELEILERSAMPGDYGEKLSAEELEKPVCFPVPADSSRHCGGEPLTKKPSDRQAGQ